MTAIANYVGDTTTAILQQKHQEKDDTRLTAKTNLTENFAAL